jgi:coenzyme F420 hydrogenase subunit beta
MGLRLSSIQDVAERHLCCGCGACAYVAPESIRMVDTLEPGRRPVGLGVADAGQSGAEAMAVCPGVGLSHSFDRRDPALIRELMAAWGPVRELWEGFASDPQIRFAGSSGGAATALALYCMERSGMHGTLHIAARPDAPYLNHTVLSTTRAHLLAATGSRYAPASPCDGLKQIEDAPAPCVFIGKPCDVAGASSAARLRARLAEKLGLTIGIFCAGTPSTRGTLEMLKAMGIDDPAALTGLRYRGNGWPGKAVATLRRPDGAEERREMTYQQSWGGDSREAPAVALLRLRRPYRRVCRHRGGRSLVSNDRPG